MKTKRFDTLLYAQVLFAISLSFVIAGPGYASVNDGLIAYYPMDGDATDASGNGNHGTNHIGLVQYASGIRGLAAWFDGRSSIRLLAAAVQRTLREVHTLSAIHFLRNPRLWPVALRHPSCF
jgi:hypothetical protein